MKKKDYSYLVGRLFGRWLVVAIDERVPYSSQKVSCVCLCGSSRSVQSKHLEKGVSSSCGCLHKEKVSAVGKANGRVIEGVLSSDHLLYQTWQGMKARCYVETATGFENYGGRGIKVCDRWLESFENFVEDMGKRPEGHTLDRRNNDGNYEPSNCKWSTIEEQNRNRRWCKDAG